MTWHASHFHLGVKMSNPHPSSHCDPLNLELFEFALTPIPRKAKYIFYRLLFKKRKSTTIFLEFLKGFQRKEHNNQTITNWTVLNATLGWLRTERWGWTCMEFPKHTDTILNWTVWGQTGQACLQHHRISMSEMKAIQKLTSTKEYIYFGFPWYVDHLET